MNARDPIRCAMAGGGPGAFIGPVHWRAARLDGECTWVCGAFSRDASKSRDAAVQYGIDADRGYPSYSAMLEAERRRGADGMQALIIATPNDSHFAIAKAALEAGFHVLSDKPVTRTLEEALALQTIVERTQRVFGLTYTYSGYSLVREARERCRRGDLGAVRKVIVEYSQGWLSTALENSGSVQAAWRVDPALAGNGGCIGDIGVHALHLLEFVTGLKVARLCADLSSLVPGRQLDDDCNILARLDNGAPALIYASQIAAGERNGLRLRVYGERGHLSWSQQTPDRLELNWLDHPCEVLYAGTDGTGLSDAARAATRLPTGHPEGYLEAFANIYRDFAQAVRLHGAGESWSTSVPHLPGIEDGVRGMRFIDAAVDNSRRKQGWTVL